LTVDYFGEALVAGDIGIEESIAAPTAAILTEASAAQPTPVLHDYGPDFRIRIGPPPATALEAAPLNPQSLSENEQLGLAALQLRQSPQYAEEKARRPYSDVAWAKGGSPLHLNERAIVGRRARPGREGDGAEASVSAAPRAKRLKGRIAVGVIMVSGPGELALTNAQQVKIAAEVQNGLSWLGAQSPARDVTWLHDNRHVSIPTPPSPRIPRRGREHWEHYERPWRDAVLDQMGFPKGKAGVDAYIASLKAKKSADAAYCAFFVHYPLNHFAYCTGPYLVMQYENDDWRPGNLDRVFAHESGHVFGAPDEYAESECNCRGRHGFFGKRNLNCESCAPDGGIRCIMKANTWAMCRITPYHLGYNGLPDEAPTRPSAHVA
jgi:hypothetical protein